MTHNAQYSKEYVGNGKQTLVLIMLCYKQNKFMRFLDDLSMYKDSIHNIRLRFLVKDLWSMLSSSASAIIASAASPAAKQRLLKT